MEHLRKAGPWLFGGIVSLCVLLGASTYLTFTAFYEFEQERLQARAANEVLTTVRELWIELQNAETGQRGYILTERPSYLDPYLAAIDRIPALKQRLQSLVAHDPELLRQASDLYRHIDDELVALQAAIERSRTDGFEGARKVFLTDAGKNAMDEIRERVGALTARQESALAKHRIETDRKEGVARNAALLASVMGLLVAVVGGILLARYYGRLRAAEADLKEQASMLQATLDNTGEGVAVFDPVKGLIAWNPRFFSFFGFPEDFPKIGRRIDDVLGFDRERQDQVFEISEDDSGIASLGQFFKLRRRAKVGGRELECSQRRTETGSIVMTCSDITERLQTEQVARQAQKMEAIGHLTGGVAHDFNNLLQVIASNLDLISKHRDDPEFIATHLEYANHAATRGAHLTRQLLAFARKQPLEPVVSNLGRRVRAMSDLLHRTLGETIQIETIVDAGLWNTFVDINQVENAILNLAVNSRDAMPAGGKLTIEVANAVIDEDYARWHDEVAPGQYVMFAVTDTGVGMPAEVAARAIDPFYTTKPDGRGTGLGLSMVYGFVKQSSGHIKIYSEVGHGTTIKIYLPRSLRPEEAEAPDSERVIESGTERILLVEDDEEVRRAVADMTRSFGYRVTEAKDGEQALSMLRTGLQVDLLFTDVVMSGAISGRTLADRARELVPSLAVLFTSGYTENAIIHHGRLEEGLHLLSKPYREAELSRKLRAVLDRREQPRGKEGDMEEAEDSATDRPAVLLVDDDALIRMSTAQMLQELGHRVRDATLAGDALTILRQNPEIDVLIVDVTLPDMNGVDLVKQASTFRRDLRVLFATGHNASTIDLDPSKINYAVLSKPYNTHQLAAALGKLGV